MMYLCVVCLVCAYSNTVSGFNLDSSVGYLPANSNGKIYNESNLPDRVNDTRNQKSEFFGYTMKISGPTSTKGIRMVIGSPMGRRRVTRSITSKGGSQPSVYSCLFEKNIFLGESSCNVSRPSDSTPGDGFGISIPTVGPDGDAVACAPAREQNCGDTKQSPGYCYQSSDYGIEWQKRAESRNIRCPTKHVDVLFVLDGSSSVKEVNFKKVISWVKKITRKLDWKNVDVGVVQYSHYYPGFPINEQRYIKTEIEIGSQRRQSSFEAALNKIEYDKLNTPTGRALQKVYYDFTSSAHAGKLGNKQVMILLTDGKANRRDKSLIKPASDALREMGVVTYAVGVGDINRPELQVIANGGREGDKGVHIVVTFDDLSKIVDELGTDIQSGLEGASRGSGHFYSAEVGFSGSRSKPPKNGSASNGRLYLGAVGAYDWSGTVTKYDSVDDQTPDIPKYPEVQKVLPNRTKESYMGYSVTTGYFTRGNEEYVATGAPRYMLMGAVVVYKPRDNNAEFNDPVTLLGHPSNRQLGSYFGGSVLTADVNNDGIDDLLVGAPLYVGDNFDEGRVFIYVSSGASTLSRWKQDSYQPLVLKGQQFAGGRFGTAIANAGDLNKDNFNDVIVGAPLTEGDRGAVFVYHGNANGVDTTAKQAILASQLTGVTLKYFGQSLQGGVDLDGNLYPDIAVGAPKSDTVVIFRSRPVVNIAATVEFTTGDIDIFECIDKNYRNCTEVRVCFTASGTSVEDTVGFKFNVTMDSNKVGADRRLEFNDDPDLATTGKATWSDSIALKRDTRSCFRKKVHMKSTIKDYDTEIVAEVQYDLLSSHTSKPLSSVRDPSIPNVKNGTLNFIKNCGNEGKCVYDLFIDASLTLPQYKSTAAGQKDLTEGGTVLIVDQSTASEPVTVKVNLTNKGENAFDTRVRVTYTSQISLSTLDNRKAYPPSNSCMVEDTMPIDIGNGLKQQILRYKYKTNIMRPNSWCYFEFNLITENLKNNGTLNTFTVNVTAFTSDSSSTSSEKNPEDNKWGLSPEVRYRSEFTLKKKEEAEISFNYTTKEANITSVREVGNRTSDIEVEFEVRGEGYSDIPYVDTSLMYPLKTSNGDMLLYLYKVDCAPKSQNSRASCSCDQSVVNTYNLTLEAPNANNTNGSYVTITPPTTPIESKIFDCYTPGEKNITCESLRCNIMSLRPSEQITFKAYFRIWSSSIMFNVSAFEEIELHSRLEVNTNNSPLIIDASGNAPQVTSDQIISKVKKYKKPVEPLPTENVIWIYIVAAIGGLLLLIAIVLILWKAGFFKSKYADMKKDAQDDLADETEFQTNGNGSGAEMVD